MDTGGEVGSVVTCHEEPVAQGIGIDREELARSAGRILGGEAERVGTVEDHGETGTKVDLAEFVLGHVEGQLGGVVGPDFANAMDTGIVVPTGIVGGKCQFAAFQNETMEAFPTGFTIDGIGASAVTGDIIFVSVGSEELPRRVDGDTSTTAEATFLLALAIAVATSGGKGTIQLDTGSLDTDRPPGTGATRAAVRGTPVYGDDDIFLEDELALVMRLELDCTAARAAGTGFKYGGTTVAE